MKKRILPLLAALVLCFCLTLCAAAESPDALYRIVLRTEEADVTLGTGVVYGEADTLLTAEGCLREGALFAIGADGEHAVSSWETLDATGAALLRLAEPSTAQPISASTMDTPVDSALHGTTAQGEVLSASYTIAQRSYYRNAENLTLATQDGLLPGAVILDQQGALVAITVSQQGEGMGLYTALYAVNLTRAADQSAFIPMTFSWDNGVVDVTWTDEGRTGGLYLLMLMGEENEFYSAMRLDADRRSTSLALAPGHTYCFLLQWLASEAASPAFDWEHLQTYTLPEGQFTQYGFEQSCSLITVVNGQSLAERRSSPTLFTVDALTNASSSRYLQIVYTHHATEELTLPLTVSLIAPDGQFYTDERVCTFTPEEAGKPQIAALPVDDLLTDCAEFSGGGELPEGEYTLCWSLAGKLAGKFTFTVTAESPMPTNTPVAKSSELVENLTVTEENGFIVVDWSNCNVPSWKKVTAYIAYEGNAYYSYVSAKASEGSARFVSIPGANCIVWAVAAEQENTFLSPVTQAQCVVFQTAAPQPIDLYGLRNLRCGLAFSADNAADEQGEYLPETPVTRQALASGDALYFQTEDTYTVAEEISGYAIAVVLTTPDGTRMMYAGEYSFKPELADSDMWLVNITELAEGYTTLLNGADWPAGEYTVAYYIGGMIVAELAFTLE